MPLGDGIRARVTNAANRPLTGVSPPTHPVNGEKTLQSAKQRTDEFIDSLARLFTTDSDIEDDF